MDNDDFRRLSRDTNRLMRLLVITWIADGKTREQIEAFCDALLLDGYTRDDLLAMFDAGQPKPDEVKRVRAETMLSCHDARAVIRRAAGNVELAIVMAKKQGLA